MTGRVAIFLAKLVAVFVVASVLWVVAYRFLPVPITWPMARDAIAGKHVERDWVPLTAMAAAVPRAAIGAEDARFCDHNGFDLAAMEAAAARNAKAAAKGSAKVRGGSTISQQTAKNAFLWPGRSYVRKALEAWFTVLIETIWGKPRIMEVYLNIAEMGPGIYGVEAAARHYFNTSAANLTTAQSARLAAVLPQPVKRDAANPGRMVKRYAKRIERRARVVRTEGIDHCLA
ncbi:monofunctional biosynthetic peptidoglycan transglycosylase [Polymorphobacter fuscus]|uniref:Biosynthetic peptidoglycan transglycosylase n=1 Tax=Sandarakinorhabdus fusca TaxID=1439888 RepID=A0A7C9GV72_9SPHN|nr:monofunctional biosynthetic peptidoglycan transglycosylase [Polymorphobacter fuscus]KAB7646120.1 monofunctional biosynthetic peptidoglycan transglycosylase [Polymorphobacter fuscus]MQT17318.1 monofunctional biosynthetic peptidoglycan transglycosylase [Polymorphobacter fuscus]NJC10149.1 monofunctional biosynthetic peptidoglycan transglycosylase [Polymorphobacter fuscus]